MSKNTKEFITILKKSHWKQNNSTKKYLLYEYITDHNDEVKGWIQKNC